MSSITLNDTSDEALLTQYIDGDIASFTVLYERHKGAMYRYLLRQVHDERLSEDLLQDIWSKIIMHSDGFVAKAKFSTWAYRIARNSLIDHFRHKRVQDSIIEQFDDTQIGIEQLEKTNELSFEVDNELQRMRQKKALKRCLEKLPPHLLEAFLLKEEGNMSGQQISDIIDASYEAVKSRLRYAYQQLRTCLQLNLSINE